MALIPRPLSYIVVTSIQQMVKESTLPSKDVKLRSKQMSVFEQASGMNTLSWTSSSSFSTCIPSSSSLWVHSSSTCAI